MTDPFQPNSTEPPTAVAESEVVCPQCSAPWEPGHESCWACYWSAEHGELVPAEGLRTPLSKKSFDLSTMLLATTFLSVWLAIMVVLPPLAICLLIVFVPSLARTICAVNVRKKEGRHTNTSGKVSLFGESVFYSVMAILSAFAICVVGMIGIVILGGVASVIASFIEPTMTGFHEDVGAFLGMGFMMIVIFFSLFAAGIVWKRTWPRRELPSLYYRKFL